MGCRVANFDACAASWGRASHHAVEWQREHRSASDEPDSAGGHHQHRAGHRVERQRRWVATLDGRWQHQDRYRTARDGMNDQQRDTRPVVGRYPAGGHPRANGRGDGGAPAQRDGLLGCGDQ
jgi:hypothetical protein